MDAGSSCQQFLRERLQRVGEVAVGARRGEAGLLLLRLRHGAEARPVHDRDGGLAAVLVRADPCVTSSRKNHRSVPKSR